MKINSLVRAAALAAFLVGGTAFATAGEPEKEDAVFSAKLFSAIQDSNYDAFVADGTEAFHGITKAQFESVAALLSAKLKAAHILYLGELSQHGYRVTLWKVAFADGSDDALATLSVKDGKVGGFWIK